MQNKIGVKRIVRIEKDIEERQIIIGLITDLSFARQIIPILKLEYFKTSFTKTIAQWILIYFEEYQDIPLSVIKDIFESKKRNNEISEDEIDLIQQFLESISDEFENTDKKPTEYLARNAEQYFKKRNLELLKQDLSSLLSIGDIDQAELVISNYKHVEREIGGSCINPFTNETAIREAFDHVSTPLFTLPGALGDSINDLMVRGGFIGIMGPEKRGKSWWLQYFARRAAMSSCNVVHFVIGDMTQNQVIVRQHIMNTGVSNKAKYCTGRHPIPVLDCRWNQTGDCHMSERVGEGSIGSMIKTDKGGTFLKVKSFEEAEYHMPCIECYRDSTLKKNWKGAVWWREGVVKDPLDWRAALKEGQKFVSKRMPGKHFKLSCHARQELNVKKGIIPLLKKWEREEGFIADVIVLDYADNMGSEDGRKEFRHQQNDTWGALRAISTEYDNLVITATQADAASYDVKTLKEKNFSEDKRKYSHVTGILTLNQDHEEKKKGIMRIGKLFVREDEVDTSSLVTVLQNLAAGQPCIGSFF